MCVTLQLNETTVGSWLFSKWTKRRPVGTWFIVHINLVLNLHRAVVVGSSLNHICIFEQVLNSLYTENASSIVNIMAKGRDVVVFVEIEPASLQGLKGEPSNKIGSRNRHQEHFPKKLMTLHIPQQRCLDFMKPTQHEPVSLEWKVFNRLHNPGFTQHVNLVNWELVCNPTCFPELVLLAIPQRPNA